MTVELDDLLAGIVRGDSGLSATLARYDPDFICERADYHGLTPLVAHHLAAAPDLSPHLHARLQLRAKLELAADLIREAEIRRAIEAFAAEGISPLLLKGAHLAYGWYERSDLRPRIDTDLLVAPDARDDVNRILLAIGYQSPSHATGALLTYQAAYPKRRDQLLIHVFDVHWRIANPQAFGAVLSFDELARAAVPVPQLGPAARAPSAADALFLACVHRVAHHFDSNRIIWLYDIHLIATGLTAAGWQHFLGLVEERKVAAVCRRSLERTINRFRTEVPAAVLADPRLRPSPAAEPTAAYLAPRRRHVHNVVNDLQALPRWRDRVRLVREHLFPSSRYMREVYGLSSRTPLPLLYAHRAVRGAWRWLERPSAKDDASLIG
jgi:hypothetical protein